MLDIGWQELFVVAILVVIVVGPKDLPKVLRSFMGIVNRIRAMAREFQSGVDDMVREAELDDIRREAQNFAEARTLENTVRESADPDGSLKEALRMTDVEHELEHSARAGKENVPPKDAPPKDTPPKDNPAKKDPTAKSDKTLPPEPVPTAHTDTP